MREMVTSQTSWNKLFEQDYLPDLLEKDNTADPITGIILENENRDIDNNSCAGE